MSLTTAVSEDDDAESVHNSPYKAKQVEYIFQFLQIFFTNIYPRAAPEPRSTARARCGRRGS